MGGVGGLGPGEQVVEELLCGQCSLQRDVALCGVVWCGVVGCSVVGVVGCGVVWDGVV